jgi:type IV pilus assembly protein PilE
MEIRNKQNLFNLKAFSLIELMVVIAVIGIITAVAYPSYTKYIMKSRRSEALTTIVNTQNKLELYYSQNNAYPPTLAALQAPPPTTQGAALALGLNYFYNYSRPTTTTYTLTANPASPTQLADTECAFIRIDNLGNKTPTACWPH